MLSKLNSKTKTFGSLLCIATILGLPIWEAYIQRNFLFYFTLLLAPFILHVRHPETGSTRYAYGSLFCLLGHLYFGINILYLAGFLFFILFVIEWQWGKLNDLSIYWIFLLSPLTVFFFGVFSFPIRLELSKLAHLLLSCFITDVSCQGNIILMQGIPFSVDAACMGLKMVGYSYLIFLVLIAYFEKQHQKQLSKPWVIGIMTLGSILILLANLIRIITIIITHAMPDTIEHEIIGIACWVVYVVLPAYFITKIANQKFGTAWKSQAAYSVPLSQTALFCGLCLFLMGIGTYLNLTHIPNTPQAKIEFNLPNITQEILNDGVIQLKNEEILIYIKPSSPPYRADHAPNICWKGSGYTFQKEASTTINGVTILTAELHQEGSILHTAWWYDNGQHQTASQLDWRWNSLKGQGNYQLINITAEHPNILNQYIQQVLQQTIHAHELK